MFIIRIILWFVIIAGIIYGITRLLDIGNNSANTEDTLGATGNDSVETESYTQDIPVNSSFGKRDFYTGDSRKDIGDVFTGSERISEREHSSEQGYFGTPSIIRANTQIARSSKTGGIIFDPPLTPPPITTNQGDMYLGTTKIRSPENNWNL